MAGISPSALAREFDKIENTEYPQVIIDTAAELMTELSNAFIETSQLCKTSTGTALASMIGTLLSNYTSKATQIALQHYHASNYWRYYDINKRL